VGLDIQNDYARAIAVQRRRNGWQLRHWWQQPLPQVVMRQGILHETEQLIAILSRWRHSLPSTISLHSGLFRFVSRYRTIGCRSRIVIPL
jgi:pilus assembly protein HofM